MLRRPSQDTEFLTLGFFLRSSLRTWYIHRSPAYLTLYVPVHNHVAVKVRDSLENLASVFPGYVFRESTIRLQLVFHWPLHQKQTEGIGKEMTNHKSRSLHSIPTSCDCVLDPAGAVMNSGLFQSLFVRQALLRKTRTCFMVKIAYGGPACTFHLWYNCCEDKQ